MCNLGLTKENLSCFLLNKENIYSNKNIIIRMNKNGKFDY